jgi:DNA-binding Xre family transcriptional regulator
MTSNNKKVRKHLNYNKLWKLLIDKNMKKQDLKAAANVSSASIAKLGRGENVTTDVLLRICEALDVELNDIVETVRDEEPRKGE